jgi:dihydroxy-acid dehydratase
LVKSGDRIRLSVKARRVDLLVDADELARRKAAWKAPVSRPQRGYAQLYMDHVTQAQSGCDFDFLQRG